MRSTFSIKYFQHVHGLDLATSGEMNSYVFLAAVFATPAFGWVCDRVGRYAPFLAFGALLLPIALAVMARHHSKACVEGAREGYRTARTELAGVLPPHDTKILACFELTAGDGFLPAKRALARIYGRGIGVPSDLSKAKAMLKGLPKQEAKERLAELDAR